MSKKGLSRGIRKYIRREKSRIRREISNISNPEKQKRELEDLCLRVGMKGE